MTINCIVIDDEFPARLLLKEYANQVSFLSLQEMFHSPVDALNFINSNQVDLIFLDIQMPEISGLDFLKVLNPMPLVILTTAYKDYALDGFELDVLDYLLKPFQFERFYKAISKAKKQLELQRMVKHEPVKIKEHSKEYITVKADRKILRIFLSEIDFIQGLREYVTFHTIKGKVISLSSLKSLEDALPDKQFMRVHKSYIVNKDKVASLIGNNLVIKDTKIPFSKNLKDKIMNEIFG